MTRNKVPTLLSGAVGLALVQRFAPRQAARRSFLVGGGLAWVAILSLAAIVPAQDRSPASLPAATAPSNPPANVAPGVIARDAGGHTMIRAVRAPGPMRIDGRLQEEFYATVPPLSGFIQNEPKAGAPGSEKTEVWIFFDATTFYVSARCWESQPDHLVVNEMRHDHANITQNDLFAFGLDTFYDRRNGVFFEVSAIGARIDGQVTNERIANLDWNPVYAANVARFEGGWTVEVAIPFKSLRYRPGDTQIWGFQAKRINRRKNEVSYITPMPASMAGRGHLQSSLMATLVGIEAPSGGRTLDLKPYAISTLAGSGTVGAPVPRDLSASAGIDAKYGVTRSLTADLTYKTDFAQVEADEQQVNLTRFSLSFPEKRDFFLENQGVFGFGGAAASNASSTSDLPLLFYSRRVGLNEGRQIPIQGGGRLSGRAGRYSLGLLNIESERDEESATPATNFTVARVQRDILRKSSIGAIVTHRSNAQRRAGRNQAYGVDASLAFYNNLVINAYAARTDTEGLPGDDASYRGQLDYAGDRYGVQLERLSVGGHFNPEVGFVRRTDIRKNFAQFRFSPRPPPNLLIRKYFLMGSMAHIENRAGRLEMRDVESEAAIEFHSADRLYVGYGNIYEFVPQPFPIATTITLPVGGYSFASGKVGLTLGNKRRLSGTVSLEHGTFYSGDKTSITWTKGKVSVTPRLSVEPRLSIDRVTLAEGTFTNRLLGSRATFSMSPLSFVSALVQYNTATRSASANVRLRWEYRPGSELFLVWNEQRDTVPQSLPTLLNRAFIVKVTRLVRF
ncbi:MAG: DUF5916 domain-containing protein [Vicinamibacterales bacterium]